MSIKMKSLSLAVLSLAGFAFAGSAMAACGGTVGAPGTGNLAAWSQSLVNAGTLNVATGGLITSECRLDAVLTGGGGSSAAYVRDDTPANESRYRAQFLLNVSALTGINTSSAVRVFSATTLAPSAGVPDVVTLTVFGNGAGNAKILGISTANSTSATGRSSRTFTLESSSVPAPANGVYRIEIDWTKGAAGNLKVWVNNATEATPSADFVAAGTPLNTAAWGGVDSAVLGLSSPTVGFRTAQINRVVSFDQFDSRRQTFIGM